MLSHYVQLQARLFGSIRVRYCILGGIYFLSEPPSTCTAFMCAHPMCVRIVNALMRLCICPGSSELSMLAYIQTSLSYQLACVSNSFL